MMTTQITFFFLLSVCCTAMAAKLESVVVKEQPGKTSIIFTLTGDVERKTFMLHAPERIVIDFDQTVMTINPRKIKLGGLISNLRSGNPKPGTLRLVFDLKKLITSISKPWLRVGPNQRQWRIDLFEKKGISGKKNVKSNHVNVNKAKTPVQVPHRPARSLRDVVVVLDPGHGGKDPGAIGPRRNAEKNVVLAIALKLKRMIDRQPGMRAVLTRKGDYYVGLRERLNIARKHNADVFVAIHADAFINHNSTGASVFALSQTGATSEAARWLAEKENYSELGGVNLSSLDDQSGLLRTVLLDLSQTATIGAGLQMGTRILESFAKITTLHNDKVEQARFVVLKSPDIPSVLVEMGFISNPREERNLINSFYQTRLSQAIFEGVKHYFWDHPPQGTRLEALSSINLHLVRRGRARSEVHKPMKLADLKMTCLLPDIRLHSKPKRPSSMKMT